MKTPIKTIAFALLLPAFASLLLPFKATAISIVAGPYLQDVTGTEATVIWVTDSDAVSWVETAPDDGLHFYAAERPATWQTKLGRAEVGKLHRVRLSGLKPGTVYRYRVYSKEVLNEEPYHVDYGRTVAPRVNKGEEPRFKTLSPGEEKIRFAVVNDIHEDHERYARMADPLGIGEMDFMVFNGDMVNYMDSPEQYSRNFIAPIASRYGAAVPFYMVRGNHESRGNHAREYMDYFATPTGMPYYMFRRGPVAFIVIDGGEDKPDSDIEYSGTCFCDQYRTDQARWLAEAVKAPEFAGAPFRVVLVHVPPTGNSWHGTLDARSKFLPVLNGAGIDLMLSAHLHRHVYKEAGDDGIAFPILINSNKEALTVEADNDNLVVKISDVAGKPVKTLIYPRK